MLEILSDARVTAPLVQTGSYLSKVNPRCYMYVFSHNTEAGEYARVSDIFLSYFSFAPVVRLKINNALYFQILIHFLLKIHLTLVLSSVCCKISKSKEFRKNSKNLRTTQKNKRTEKRFRGTHKNSVTQKELRIYSGV